MTPELLNGAAGLITGTAGIIIGALGWLVNRSRAKNDAAASLIDDLAGQLTEARDTMAAANVTLRITLDYAYALRNQVQELDAQPIPWPENLTLR